MCTNTIFFLHDPLDIGSLNLTPEYLYMFLTHNKIFIYLLLKLTKLLHTAQQTFLALNYFCKKNYLRYRLDFVAGTSPYHFTNPQKI
jgi:hypothetical protein